MKRIQRLALGGIFGGSLAALALTLTPVSASAFALPYFECVETKSAVCCEWLDGTVDCWVK